MNRFIRLLILLCLSGGLAGCFGEGVRIEKEIEESLEKEYGMPFNEILAKEKCKDLAEFIDKAKKGKTSHPIHMKDLPAGK